MDSSIGAAESISDGCSDGVVIREHDGESVVCETAAVGCNVRSIEADGDMLGRRNGANDGDVEPSDGAVVIVVDQIDGVVEASEFADIADDGYTVGETDDWRGIPTTSCDGAGI